MAASGLGTARPSIGAEQTASHAQIQGYPHSLTRLVRSHTIVEKLLHSLSLSLSINNRTIALITHSRHTHENAFLPRARWRAKQQKDIFCCRFFALGAARELLTCETESACVNVFLLLFKLLAHLCTRTRSFI